MLTIVGAIILVAMFFTVPYAVILAALGYWIGGLVGATIGAILGFFLQGAA